MKKYKAIIFDLDGTLLNTLPDLHHSVNAILDQYRLPRRTYDEVRSFVGNGVDRLMKLALPEGTDDSLFTRVCKDFKEYYQVHCNDETTLYPGIPEMLSYLSTSGYALAIVSNKYQAGIDLLTEQYFRPYLSVAIGEIPGRPRKPAPDGVFAALSQLGFRPEEAVYAGDSEVDIATARNAGLCCIAVGWGFRTRTEQEAAGGTVFAASPEELCGILRP